MLKNIIIATQTLIIAFGILWAYSYNDRVQQIFLVGELGTMANQARFMVKVERHIAAGNPQQAQKILKGTVAAWVTDMEEITTHLDPDMDDLMVTAGKHAAVLHSVGIYDVSNALDRRIGTDHRDLTP